VATLAQQAVTLLREARVKLDPGLDQAEMSAVEEKYGISFGDDHRALLSLAVPVSKKDVHVSTKWVDWRRGEETEIRRRLAWPLDGAVFDVFHDDFWPASWGLRPAVDDDALEAQARLHMARWPKLIPLYSHRYLPAAPAPLGSPVFSVVQTDVVQYGANLLDYLNNELGPQGEFIRRAPGYRYPPWSDFEMDPTNEDL